MNNNKKRSFLLKWKRWLSLGTEAVDYNQCKVKKIVLTERKIVKHTDDPIVNQMTSVLRLIENRKELLLYNDNNYLSIKELANINKQHDSPVEIIKPLIITVRIKDKEKKILTANVYLNRWYNHILIKDEVFNEAYFQAILNSRYGYLTFKTVHLLVGIDDEREEKYYKVIKKVFSYKC